MTEQEQVFHLADEIDKVINRFRKEYDITYATIVGVPRGGRARPGATIQRNETNDGDYGNQEVSAMRGGH